MKHEPFDDLFLVSQSNARRVNLVILGNRDLEKVCKHRLEHLRKALEERKKEPLVAQDCETGLKAIDFLQSNKVQAWQSRELWYLLGVIVERVDVRLCSEYWKDGKRNAAGQALSASTKRRSVHERRDAIRAILAGTDTRFIDEGKKLARQKKISLHEACRIIDEKHPELRLAMLTKHDRPFAELREDGTARDKEGREVNRDGVANKILRLLNRRSAEMPIGVKDKFSLRTIKSDLKAIFEQENARRIDPCE